jgi:hypothetical protein
MSLNGVTGGGAALLRPYEGVRPKVDQERPTVVAPQPQAVRPTVAGAGLLAPRQETLPMEAPAGTDPELWQVLNSAERAFFSKMTSMGPLTYGRQTTAATPGAGRAAEAPLARGVRIDVKV